MLSMAVAGVGAAEEVRVAGGGGSAGGPAGGSDSCGPPVGDAPNIGCCCCCKYTVHAIVFVTRHDQCL